MRLSSHHRRSVRDREGGPWNLVWEVYNSRLDDQDLWGRLGWLSKLFPSYGRDVKIVGIAYRLSEYLVTSYRFCDCCFHVLFAGCVKIGRSLNTCARSGIRISGSRPKTCWQGADCSRSSLGTTDQPSAANFMRAVASAVSGETNVADPLLCAQYPEDLNLYKRSCRTPYPLQATVSTPEKRRAYSRPCGSGPLQVCAPLSSGTESTKFWNAGVWWNGGWARPKWQHRRLVILTTLELVRNPECVLVH